MPVEFRQWLEMNGVDPREVNLIRHTPPRSDGSVARHLPVLAAQERSVFLHYQGVQSPNREASLLKRPLVASFAVNENGDTVFCGVQRRAEIRALMSDRYFGCPEGQRLRKLGNMRVDDGPRYFFVWEDVDVFVPFIGYIAIDWTGGTRAIIQHADTKDYSISALSKDSLLVPYRRASRDMVLSFDELLAIPSTWRAQLAEWRDIYLITDASDGARYVGSASGLENLWQRWNSYRETGHGGNMLLKKRDPTYFHFSILQLLDADKSIADVLAIENSWKARLRTRRRDHGPLGLNDN